MAVELCPAILDDVMGRFAGKETELVTALEKGTFCFTAGGETLEVAFEISDFDRALVEAGGWVGYADKHY
jgi:3-isopropylmalate/(R)-2-methylmalate dehydratase small subunit